MDFSVGYGKFTELACSDNVPLCYGKILYWTHLSIKFHVSVRDIECAGSFLFHTIFCFFRSFFILNSLMAWNIRLCRAPSTQLNHIWHYNSSRRSVGDTLNDWKCKKYRRGHCDFFVSLVLPLVNFVKTNTFFYTLCTTPATLVPDSGCSCLYLLTTQIRCNYTFPGGSSHTSLSFSYNFFFFYKMIMALCARKLVLRRNHRKRNTYFLQN